MEEKKIEEAINRFAVLDVDFIKDQLFYLAENLHTLAEKLTDSGPSLTDSDRKLVRLALSSHWLEEVFFEAKMHFVSGNREFFDRSFERVQRIFDSLT